MRAAALAVIGVVDVERGVDFEDIFFPFGLMVPSGTAPS